MAGKTGPQQRFALGADLWQAHPSHRVRLLVGTALLVATAFLLETRRPAQRRIYLYGIIGALYVASLVSMLFLRRRLFLHGVAYLQICADLAAATGLVYLTGGVEASSPSCTARDRERRHQSGPARRGHGRWAPRSFSAA
jgi:hypothetical protein